MNGGAALLLGFGLGLRHALDVDHVVVVSALVQREPGVARAARIAAWWGVGHSATCLALGSLIVVAGLRPPAWLELAAEILVGAMLVGLGAWHLARRREPIPPTRARATTEAAKPMLIGVVHGAAGSAGIALLATASIASRATAVAYLALFGVGTVLGMVTLTTLAAGPLSRLIRGSRWEAAATVVASALSVCLGGWIVLRALLSAP